MAGSYSPQSGVQGVHIRRDLGFFSVGYHPVGRVAEQVWPVLSVTNEEDDYWFWDKGQAFNMLRSDGKGSLVADGTPSKELSFGATIKSYKAQQYKLKTKITDRQRRNADSSLRLEQSKTKRVKDLLYLDYETRVASQVTNGNNYASANKTTLSGTSQWDNASFASIPTNGQSAIQAQLLAGKEAVRKATGGLVANKILIPEAVLTVMANDKGLAELYKYTRSDSLASGNPFGPKIAGMEIVCPTIMSQSVTEGEAPNLADVWGNNVVIFYSEPNPGLDSLTFGLTMRVGQDQVRSWRDEEIESTWYEPAIIQDERPISFDCAYIIISAIS